MLSNLYFLLAAGANAALVTQYVHVTQYVYEDVHVFVDGQGKPVSTSVDMIATTLPVTETATTSTISLSATTGVTSGHALNAGAFQFIDSSSTAAVTTSSEAPVVTSTQEAPAPTTSQEAPAPTTSEAPAPTTSQEPPAPTTSEAPVRTTSEEPSPSTSSAAPSSSSSDSGSGSGSGETFHGQATYYAVGLGACGVTNTDDELIVALNVDQFNSFGAMSNGNPVCNRKIVLRRGGKSVTATVTDKCPGCKFGDLDLSPAAFNQIASEAEGRVAITWQWAS